MNLAVRVILFDRGSLQDLQLTKSLERNHSNDSSFRLICDFFQHTGLLTLSYCSTTLDSFALKLLLYQIWLKKFLSVYVHLWFVYIEKSNQHT